MPRLQIDLPTELHSQLKEVAKEQNKLFRPFVVEMLEKAVKPKPVKSLVLVDERVEQVINHFEKQIARVRSRKAARKAAEQLLEDYGFEKVIGYINATKRSQGMEFAPVIESLPTLQKKWINLEVFIKKYLTQSQTRVFVPTRSNR